MSNQGNDPHTLGNTASTGERPWHRRSPLRDRKAAIRALVAEGYSLRQIIQRLDLRVSRSALWRFLHRTTDPAVCPAVKPAPVAQRAGFEPPPGQGPAESAEVATDDAAAEALLATTQFSPPTRKVSR